MKTKFYGVGVGPGDPDLLTLKAEKIINSVDVLICPIKKEGASSFAFEIVEPNYTGYAKKVEMIFPMHYDTDELKKSWQANANQITSYLKEGKTCAFITLGDPTVYSTFIYLLPYIDGDVMDLEIVPGITSFCAVASTMQQPLMVWEESLKVMPVRKNDYEYLNQAVTDNENIVLMKPSHNPEGIVKVIREHQLEDKFMMISKVGTESSTIIKDISELENMKIPYLSTMVIKKGGFFE